MPAGASFCGKSPTKKYGYAGSVHLWWVDSLKPWVWTSLWTLDIFGGWTWIQVDKSSALRNKNLICKTYSAKRNTYPNTECDRKNFRTMFAQVVLFWKLNALCCSADWLPVLAWYALCSLKILLHHTFVGVVWLTGGQKSKQSRNSVTPSDFDSHVAKPWSVVRYSSLSSSSESRPFETAIRARTKPRIQKSLVKWPKLLKLGFFIFFPAALWNWPRCLLFVLHVSHGVIERLERAS